jgi:hypothetical protein
VMYIPLYILLYMYMYIIASGWAYNHIYIYIYIYIYISGSAVFDRRCSLAGMIDIRHQSARQLQGW